MSPPPRVDVSSGTTWLCWTTCPISSAACSTGWSLRIGCFRQACMAATSRWGSAGAYGVVTMPFSVREGTCKSHELRCLGSTLSVALPGINVFLDGFIPTDACMQHLADRCRQWISARASMRATTCAEIQENLRFREAPSKTWLLRYAFNPA